MLLPVTLALASCARPNTQTSPIVACAPSRAGTAAAPWREIRGDGFTFCLPPGWRRASDVNGYTDRDGTIAWARNGRPVDITSSRPVVAIVRGASPSDVPQLGVQEVQTTTCPAAVPEPEQIGDHAALLRSSECRGSYNTSASWSEPALLFAGVAPSAASAARQLAIYRTVRFVDTAPHR